MSYQRTLVETAKKRLDYISKTGKSKKRDDAVDLVAIFYATCTDKQKRQIRGEK